MNNIIVYDGIFEVAAPTGGISWVSPLPHTAEKYVLRQDFMQFAANYTALELNTAHPVHSDYKLVEETEKQDIGGALVRWTRIYAKKPASWSEPGPGNYVYTFVGLDGTFGVNVESIEGRDSFAKSVPVRIARDYYMVGTGGDYTTAEDIPTIAEQKYYFQTEAVRVELLRDSPPFAAPTTPSRTEYEGMIAASEEIVVERSTVTRWLGNFFVRETHYVIAE